MLQHSMTLRVYYADTDALGIVYHANYLKFFELARTESLRSIGIELRDLKKEYGVLFAVVHANIQYHKPARLDDMLILTSRVSKIGHASVSYQQNAHLSDNKDVLLCSADIKLVTIDMEMRPQGVPDTFKCALMKGI